MGDPATCIPDIRVLFEEADTLRFLAQCSGGEGVRWIVFPAGGWIERALLEADRCAMARDVGRKAPDAPTVPQR